MFANDAPTSEMATMGTLAHSDQRLVLGHLLNISRKSGMVRYMIPVEVVPMAAMPPCEAKGSVVM